MGLAGFPVPTPLWPTLRGQTWPLKRTVLAPPSRLYRASSGKERSFGIAAFPVREYELKFSGLLDQTQNQTAYAPLVGQTDLMQIAALYLECLGPYGEFFYDDPSDDSRTGALLGTGDGSTTQFVATRPWQNGATTLFLEPVGGIAAVNTLYFNGTPQSSSIYGWNGNVVGFLTPPPPNTTITMDFQYYWLCRFESDQQEFEQFMRNYWSSTIRFRTVKGWGGGSPLLFLLSIVLIDNGTGVVTSADNFINAPTVSSHYYTPGTSVTLTATPTAPSTFQGWSGQIGIGASSGPSLTNPLTVLMNKDRTIYADFKLPNVNLFAAQFSPSIGVTHLQTNDGYINTDTSQTQAYVPGTTVTITATPGACSVFNEWTGGPFPGTTSTSNPLTVTLNTGITADAKIIFSDLIVAATLSNGGFSSGSTTTSADINPDAFLLAVLEGHFAGTAQHGTFTTTDGLTWHLINESLNASGFGIQLYWTHASSLLTAGSVTYSVSYPQIMDSINMEILQFRYVNASPFDTNPGAPIVDTSSTPNPPTIILSTNQHNDYVLTIAYSTTGPPGGSNPLTTGFNNLFPGGTGLNGVFSYNALVGTYASHTLTPVAAFSNTPMLYVAFALRGL